MTVRQTLAAAAASALLFFSLAAQAQTASADTAEARRAAAERFVRSVDDLIGPSSILKMMRDALQANTFEELKQHPGLTDLQRKRAAEVVGREMGAVVADMVEATKPGLNQAMTQIYAERFTVGEIDELTRLYANPVMRKATVVSVEELPRLMAPMSRVIEEWEPKLQQRAAAARSRLRTEGIDLAEPERPHREADTLDETPPRKY